MGVEVEIGQLPRCWQAGEAGQAGLAALFGGRDLDREQPFQKRSVSELAARGVFQFAGQCFSGRGQAQRGQVPAQLLIDRCLTHRVTPVASVTAAVTAGAATTVAVVVASSA